MVKQRERTAIGLPGVERDGACRRIDRENLRGPSMPESCSKATAGKTKPGLVRRRERGSPGVDGISIRKVRESPTGVDGLLARLGAELKAKTYKPQMVKRVYIPKANGKLRPLGIPTVYDRVAQMAVLLVLEPIFEADFL